MKRLNLIIPEELHTQFKIICASQGKPMTDVLVKLIRDYVEKAGKKKIKQ
jgi:hypothetical protein